MDKDTAVAFEDDTTANDDELRQVAALAALQLKQEQLVATLDKQLKEAKKDLRRTSEIDLPTLLDEIGLLSITLTDGSTVTIDESLYATVAKKNKAAAAKWLEQNGQEAVVKNELSITMGTGERDKLLRLTGLLDSTEFREYSLTSSMNTGTVKAVIKELMQQGVDVPLDLFGAHFVRKSIIK